MDEEKFIKLKGFYGRLIGIKLGFPTNNAYDIRKEIANDFNNVVEEIEAVIEQNMDNYKIPRSAFYLNFSRSIMCNAQVAVSKIEQLISYLEFGFGLGQKIQEIGSLVNAVKDQDLRERCLDLLSASSKFDRVINQATLILEDRIRIKAGISEKLEGVKLINKVLNPDLTKTVLKISDNSDEQQGFCDLCRGIMLAFRNPTHHQITDKFTREDALKVCGFIDLILGTIEKSTKIK